MLVPQLNEPGRQIKKIREKLLLKYRDVAEASQRLARQHGNAEFRIGLSRLADIENKGTIPSIYKLYSLGVIYGTDITHLLAIFGVNVSQMPGDSIRMGFAHTREARFELGARMVVDIPAKLDESFDLRSTSYMSRYIHRWGKLPVLLLQSLDLRSQRYAFIGTEDWSMHPLIRAGSFVQIDEAKRQIKRDAWVHEYEKPIYFLEHRNGFRCGWCTLRDGWLVAQSHPASAVPPEIYKYPGDVDVLGQVVGVAMRLDLEKRRRIRS
jgi:transcriptional regulator with XRE-family HTH domain